MFGRQVGYYDFSALGNYLFPKKEAIDNLQHFLPKTEHQYYYSSARHGIYQVLQSLKGDKLRVAMPAWSCSILYSVVSSLNVEIILLDVDPLTMRMKAGDLIEQAPDVAILVAENGALYRKEEIELIKSAGITTIGDYCLAMRNFNMLEGILCDYNIFSGGFSKPVSSLGLGIVCTDNELHSQNVIHKNFNPGNIFLLLVHYILQVPFLYSLIQPFLGEPKKEVFEKEANPGANLRHISIFASELDKFRSEQLHWKSLQDKIYSIIGITPPSYLLSKILIPEERIQKATGIHFHHQYQWTRELDPAGREFPNMKIINENYRSLSVNRSCLRSGNKFITSLKKALTNGSTEA